MVHLIAWYILFLIVWPVMPSCALS
jgi:hypothetical protein